MAPKNKGKAKDAGDSTGSGSSKLKPATSINVRHILCEKHSKKEQALEALREGRKFDDVAREMSEDKGRQGMFIHPIFFIHARLFVPSIRSCRSFVYFLFRLRWTTDAEWQSL